MVYDERSNFVGDTHWREDTTFDEGEELELERGGIMVEVGECVGTREQDLSELVDKRVKEREGKIEAISHKVSTERAALMDLDPPQKGLKRAMPFLPDPPSFDLTVTPNQWHT